MPFLAEGLRTGKKCICILDSLGPADVLVRLGRRVDLDRSVEKGQRTGGEVLMDTLRTHPVVIVDGMIHENPYDIEPSTFPGGTGLNGGGQPA
jgi:hypothetical protein